jgi:hypothetical protein
MCSTVVLESRLDQGLAMSSRRGLVAGEEPVQGVDRGGEAALCDWWTRVEGCEFLSMELEAVMRVSESNGSLLKRASVLAFFGPGRLLLVRCVAKERINSGRRKGAALQQGTRLSCLSPLTRSLSRQKKHVLHRAPFCPCSALL